VRAAGSRPDAAAPGRPALGLASATTAVLVWGASSVLVKEVDANGVAVAAHRLWIGAAVTSAVFLVAGGRITRRLLRLSVPGGLFFVADIMLFFSALQATSVANATIIGALQPVLLLAVSVRLFGERAYVSDAVWGLVAMAGAVVVVLGGDGGGARSLWGDLLAVGALLSWSGYFVASKQARTQLTSFEYLTGLTLVAAVAVVPFPFVLGQSLEVGDGRSWALIALIAVVNGALGHFLMNWSHAHVRLVVVSLLTLAIPVVAAGAAALLIDEPLAWVQMAGMAVVIGALAVIVVNGARRRPRQARAEAQAVEELPTP
jgi:drug/metabolite transporter (DMT)-like permease